MSRKTVSPALRVRLGATTLAVASLLLSGCAGSGETPGSDAGAEEFSLAYGVANDVEENPYKLLAKQYMDEHPNVTITLNELPADTYAQVLPTQLQAGNASDVFVTSAGSGEAIGVVRLADAGLLAPLSNASAGVIPAGSEAAFQIDGKTYGQPLAMSFFGTIFNENAGAEANIEYPEDWASLKAACEDAAAGGRSLFALAGTVPPNTGLLAQVISSTRVYASDPDWNEKRAAGTVSFADSDGWVDTLQTIVDLNDAGCFQDGAAGAGFDALTGGLMQGTSLSAFIPGDAANTFGMASDGAVEFTVHPFPAESESDKRFGILESAYPLSVAKNSKNIAAAQAFLDWLTEPKQSKTFADIKGNLPISGLADLDLADTVYAPVANLIAEGAYTAQPLGSWPNAGVYDALSIGVQGLLTGQKTVDQVLTEMDKAWDN